MNDDSVGLVMDCLKKELKITRRTLNILFILVCNCLILFILAYSLKKLFYQQKILVRNNKNKEEQTKNGQYIQLTH